MNIKLNVEFFSEFNPQKRSILFLHGFTGSLNDWRETAKDIDSAFNTAAMDLIGHGKSSSPEDSRFYKSDELVKQILFVITEFKIKKVILCGYSMGGRAALNFASAYPEKISALILESTSAGIEIETERKAREIADKKLADFIYSYSIEEFVNSWLDSELFSSLKQLPEEKLKKLKTSKLHNSKIGLINSLIGFGTGVMPFIGNQITKMNFPVLLITGRHDSKFTQINTDLVNQFLNAEHKIIEGAGHNTHLEVPMKYNTVINQFLKKI